MSRAKWRKEWALGLASMIVLAGCQAAPTAQETRQPRPVRTAVAERVDVENLTSWFLSVLFCGTGDAFQGPGQFFDATRPSARRTRPLPS